MAALRIQEDATNGRLTLSASVVSRLVGAAGGVIWLVVVLGFILISNGGEVDWLTLIVVGVFVLLPIVSALLNALMTTTITLDRGTRTLTQTKQWIGIPTGTITVAFSELTAIQLQSARAGTKSREMNVWSVSAVTRADQRIPLNWQGTQSEMTDLAQKISTFTGVPWAESNYKLPTAVADVLKKIAPEQMTELDQTGNRAPTSQPSAVPVANELQPPAPLVPAPRASAPHDYVSANDTFETLSQIALTADSAPSESTPKQNLSALSLDELTQRVAADTMDSDARYALARQWHARGQVDRAIALYQETMRLDSTNIGAQNDLGVALQARGKRAEAEAAYRRAIALDPFSFIAHLNLALLLRATNRAAEASSEFFQVRQNARGDAETRMAEAASSGSRVDPQLSKT